MLTIKALADAAGMTSRMIFNYENGRSDVPTGTIGKLSKALNYPEAFFKGADIEELDPEWVSFRSMKTMTAAKRNAALSAGSIAILFNDWLEKRFQPPETDLWPFIFEITGSKANIFLNLGEINLGGP